MEICVEFLFKYCRFCKCLRGFYGKRPDCTEFRGLFCLFVGIIVKSLKRGKSKFLGICNIIINNSCPVFFSSAGSAHTVTYIYLRLYGFFRKNIVFLQFMKASKENHIVEIKNKKASFLYFLMQEYCAGLVLCGSEIKSIRAGKANLNDAYCCFISGELWVMQMHIAEYRFSSFGKFEAKRDRKLLLTRKELRKLEAKSKEKGYTIVPTMLYIDERGWCKLQIALAKGKHSFDKRESIKQRDNDRDIKRQLS